jgi:hypothetical protein
MNQVRESVNASAYVVLNKKGEHVATVQFKFPKDGAGQVQCDVWARKPGEKYLSLVHQKKAGGYGYDKKTAALSGAVIEGFRMANHCGSAEVESEKKRESIMRAYLKIAPTLRYEDCKPWSAKLARIGARFANWKEGEGFTSAHFESGLDRLRSLGFQVIDAL